MSNFQESGINFKFQSPKWNVVKYDEHLAHKKVSNALQPTKAVDFLGIHDNRQLFLVEVKNYRGHTHAVPQRFRSPAVKRCIIFAMNPLTGSRTSMIFALKLRLVRVGSLLSTQITQPARYIPKSF